MNELLMTYGYFIVFLGTFLEGETVLIVASFLAHRGYLNIYFVIFSALLGTLFGDQLYFFLARFKGQNMLLKHPGWKDKIEKFNIYLHKYKTFIILGYRFLYGLRAVGSFAIGLSKISVVRFVLLNILGALLWAVAIGLTGYFFGHLVEIILGDLKKIEFYIAGGIAAFFLVFYAFKFFRKNKTSKK